MFMFLSLLRIACVFDLNLNLNLLSRGEGEEKREKIVLPDLGEGGETGDVALRRPERAEGDLRDEADFGNSVSISFFFLF